VRGGTRKRGTTWTWYLGVVDPATSRRRQLSKGGFRTKREAQAAPPTRPWPPSDPAPSWRRPD
jgi:hypothetical protein